MFKSIKKFFGFGAPAAPEVQTQAAPYKVPEPAATTPIPLVVEVAPVAVEAAPVAKPKAVRKPAAAKAPAKPKAVKKPAASKAKSE